MNKWAGMGFQNTRHTGMEPCFGGTDFGSVSASAHTSCHTFCVLV